MLKNSFFYESLSSCRFVLKLGWRISKKRVIMEFLYVAANYTNWLVVSCVLIRFILDMAMKQTEFGKMMGYVWTVVILGALLDGFQCWFEHKVEPVTDVLLYDEIHQILYEKACQVDLACFEDHEFYNNYMMSISQAYPKIRGSLRSICSMIAEFAAMIAAFVILFQMDQSAILFVIFPILGNFVFYGLLNSRIFRMERENIVFQRIADYVNRTIHLNEYAKEIRMTSVFRLLKKQYDRAVASMHRVIGRYSIGNILLFWLFQYFTFTLLQEGALIYAGYRVLVSGTMVFAQMAVFQTIMNSNTWTLLNFADNVMEVVKDRQYIDQLQSFLSYEPKIPEDAEGLIPEQEIRTIEFSHVCFGYKEGTCVLKDISFRVEAGQNIALAGYNGAGKSTIIKLLLRLYDPDRGEIKVNGTDIRKYQVKAYRALFATAFQDGKIFADTLAENILMGRHRTEQEDLKTVWHALELAGLAKEVRSWPLQEQTILTREFSKEGIVLSGGQNQKILAARAFAKNSPIAVFDEPSSALDPLSEYQLFEHIRGYAKQKILFFISHRLSSVQSADLVLFLENGRIQERGNHKELMIQNGKYAELYRVQARNYQAGGKEEAV